MKVVINNLNKPILSLKGKPVEVQDDPNGEKEYLYIREVLANLCAVGYDKTKTTDVPKLYMLSVNIMKADESLEIDDEDLALIKKTIESNKPEYKAYVLGPVMTETGIYTTPEKKAEESK